MLVVLVVVVVAVVVTVMKVLDGNSKTDAVVLAIPAQSQ